MRVKDFGDMAVNSNMIRPVFIVGMNGSGTTMLLESLGLHSELYAFPYESKLIPYLLDNLHRYGDLDNDDHFLRLWNAVRSIPSFRKANQNILPPIPENWRQFPRTFSAVLDAYFRYFAAKQGKARWCEKTPQHIQHLKRLSEAYPNAKFIHMIRDGRDCAASLYRRWKRAPELTIFRWKNVVRLGRNEGKMLGVQYMEVKYEDLTEDPQLWMGNVCSFLELPFEEAVLQSRYRRSEKKGQMGVIEPHSGNWRTRFSEKKIARLERIAGTTLDEYGYALMNQPFDEHLPTFTIIYWRTKDFICEFSYRLWKKLTGKAKRRTWRELLKFPLVAIKQLKSNKY